MTPASKSPAQLPDAVVDAARQNALDHYLSALLAPRVRRGDLIVLAAFEGEIDRIPSVTSDPMHAEFRFQWWRDTIANFGAGATGNPIADAFADVVARHALARDDLEASIDARAALLAAGEFGSAGEFLQVIDRIDGAAMARFARVVAQREASAAEIGFFNAAGSAVFLARTLYEAGLYEATLDEARLSDVWSRKLLDGLSVNTRFTGSLPEKNAAHWFRSEAQRQLDAARQLLCGQSSLARRSALPLALVEPYLHASETYGLSPPRGVPRPILPLSRIWRLWRLARLARL